ncbi:MAG: electron transport complex subunit RsxE [Elusimicrobiota bacterium]
MNEHPSKRGKLKNAFLDGIIKGNPVLVLMIGLCPVLAISNTVANGIGMSIAVAFVLVGSNIVISAVRKITPDELRIPIFIIIISTFVTIADYYMQAYSPEIYKQLGVFVPLIVVNCIILGRAEGFAYKNGVVASALDGLGSSIGFGIVLVLISAIREVLGNGSFLGYKLFSNPALIMILPPGGFISIALLMGILTYVNRRKKHPSEKGKLI